MRTKDKVCIGYFGNAEEYLVQLRALRPNIEAALPGLSIYLSARDGSMGRYSGLENVISLTEFKKTRNEFGRFYEIAYAGGRHPVEQLLEESGIPIEVAVPRTRRTSRCVICAEGVYPTRSLSAEQRGTLMGLARGRGMRAEFGDDVMDAGWVVGVECPALYEAAFNGVEVSLVETGVGGDFFGKLFPGYPVLKI